MNYHRLSTFLEGNSILNETQSGFRKDYSTIDNIFSLYSLTEYFKSKKVSNIAGSSISRKPLTVYGGTVCGKKYLNMAYKAKHLT